MGIVAEHCDLRPIYDCGWGVNILDNYRLPVIGQAREVAVEPFLQVRTRKIVLRSLRGTVGQQRRVQNHESWMRRVVRLAELHQADGEGSVSYRPQAFSAGCLRLSRYYQVAKLRIEKHPFCVREMPVP